MKFNAVGPRIRCGAKQTTDRQAFKIFRHIPPKVVYNLDGNMFVLKKALDLLGYHHN